MYIEVDYLNYHNKWVLGTTFLKKYNTLFDYELKKVYFYKPIKRSELYSNKMVLTLPLLLLLNLQMQLTQ